MTNIDKHYVAFCSVCGQPMPVFAKEKPSNGTAFTHDKCRRVADIDKATCPEFPFFGANYPDARCIDGYLWDLDSCGSDPNIFEVGGEIPCPFCNQDEFIEYDPLGVSEEHLMVMDYAEKPSKKQIDAATQYTKKFYSNYIKQLGERYGK